MRQSITTRYIPATSRKGSRYKATFKPKEPSGWTNEGQLMHYPELSATTHADHSLSLEGNHCEAARQCAIKHRLPGLWIAGGSLDGNGYVYVQPQGWPSWRGLVDERDAPALDLLSSALLGVEGRDWFHLLPIDVAADAGDSK